MWKKGVENLTLTKHRTIAGTKSDGKDTDLAQSLKGQGRVEIRYWPRPEEIKPKNLSFVVFESDAFLSLALINEP